MPIHASRSGLSLSQGEGGDDASDALGAAVINSKEFLKFKFDQDRFVSQQIELYLRHLDRDCRSSEIAFDKRKAYADELQALIDSITCEHRDLYLDSIQPAFDPLKARHFDSS